MLRLDGVRRIDVGVHQREIRVDRGITRVVQDAKRQFRADASRNGTDGKVSGVGDSEVRRREADERAEVRVFDRVRLLRAVTAWSPAEAEVHPQIAGRAGRRVSVALLGRLELLEAHHAAWLKDRQSTTVWIWRRFWGDGATRGGWSE